MKYGVSSFPTLIFFSKDNKEGEHYEGGRSEEDFVNFLNEKCGTQRAVGGGLNEKAGRVPSLDTLAAKFFSAASDAKQTILDEAIALKASAGPSAEQYVKIMKKVVNDSEAYLTKEAKRYAN